MPGMSAEHLHPRALRPWLWLGVCLAALVPAHPATGQPILSEVASLPLSAAVVHADGTLAVAASGDILTVVDLSDPAQPSIQAQLELTDRIWDAVVDGDRAYLANGFVGLVVVDLADPGQPRVAGSYEVVSQGQTVSVAMAGALVLTANNQTGLNVFDVSDPSSPTMLSEWLTGGYSRDVIGLPGLGLVADQPDGLHVVGIDMPEAPEETSIHFAEGETTQLVTVAPATRTAFIADGATTLVEIVDLADPATPERVGTYEPSGRVVQLTARGEQLYLAHGRGGLSVVSVADPANPTVVATYPAPTRAVALVDDLVLAAGADTLTVLRAP